MADGRSGAKVINRNGQEAADDGVVRVSENYVASDAQDHHHNSTNNSRINYKIPQQPKTRAAAAAAAGRGGITTTTSCSSSSPPKYLEPPLPKQNNNVHGIIRKTQQRAPTSSRGSDHEYQQQQQGSSAVPRFGEWEEKDHVSGQGYTRAFERITDHRNMAGGGYYVQSPRRPTQTPQRDHESMGWCFFWRRKYNK